MELKYLKTFRTIITVGSFQRAAEILNYSQSTITFQMQQLEQQLCVRLFEKIGRRMVPTQAAQELLPHIDIILEQFSLIKSYGKELNELSGELTIAMPESFLTYQSQRTLKKFREEAPNVRLRLQTQNCFVIREQLISGQIDFGVHYDVGGYDAGIQREKVKDYELCLICAPAFRDRDFITKHQRKPVCLLTDDKNSIFFSILVRYFKERDIVMENILELGSIETIKRSVASNVGIAILPRFTVERELENNELNVIPTKIKEPKITAICAWHKNKWLSPAMALFIALIKEMV